MSRDGSLRVHAHEGDHGEAAVEQFRVDQVGDLLLVDVIALLHPRSHAVV